MKNNIIVFEPNMNGLAHTEINAGLLSIFEGIHKEDYNLIFISDKRHYLGLKRKVNMNQWNYKEVKVLDYKLLLLILNDFILLQRILRLLFFGKNTQRIYLLGILPISQIILSFFNKFFKKDVIIALHGQMEAYLPNTKIGVSRFYYLLSKKVFQNADNIRYLVFGHSIKRNLVHLFKENGKIITLDQPYLFNTSENFRKYLKKDVLTLGVIGRADNGKNIQEIFVLIDLLKKYIDNKQLQVKVVGKLSIPVPDNYKNYFTYHTETVDNDIFTNEILSLDFALSFTGEEYYRATPSGVLFDCIKWNIPILGLKNDYINYYFEKFGHFGQLYSSTKEMADHIADIICSEESFDFNKYQSVFLRLRNELSISNLILKVESYL